MDALTIRGEGITLDLLLWRKYGVRGQSLVEAAFDANPGLSDLGPVLPLGTPVLIPDLPVEARPAEPLLTLFG